jgi:hypothetical protein
MNWIRINIDDPTTWPKLGQRVLLQYVYNDDCPEIATLIYPDQNYKFYLNKDGKPLIASKDFDGNNIYSFEDTFCWMPLPELSKEEKKHHMEEISRICNERYKKSQNS